VVHAFSQPSETHINTDKDWRAEVEGLGRETRKQSQTWRGIMGAQDVMFPEQILP